MTTARNALLDLAEHTWRGGESPGPLLLSRLLLIGNVLGNERMICVACDIAQVFLGAEPAQISAFVRGQGGDADQVRASLRAFRSSALEYLFEAAVHRHDSTRFVASQIEAAFDVLAAKSARSYEGGRSDIRALASGLLIERVPWEEMLPAIVRLDSAR